MRRGFESGLQEYNKLAKAEAAVWRPFDREIIEEDIDTLTHELSGEQQTDIASQRQVYDLQKDKLPIMERLRAQLEALDNPEAHAEQEPGDWYVHVENEEYIAERNGASMPVTRGDLMVDGNWGVNYNLDHETVPRAVRKRFIVEQARRELQNVLDAQIITAETTSVRIDNKMVGAYEALRQTHPEGREKYGHIAERMVRTFLEKLTYNYPKLDFTIERADAHQDAEEKIDFLIHRKIRNRGVKVDLPPEGKKDEGIQFTTNESPEAQEYKRNQLDRVRDQVKREEHIDDLVLVTLPMREFADVYTAWAQHKTPGGPEQMWDGQTKERIFRGLLKGFLKDEELDDNWRYIQSVEVGRRAIAA
jgi:hypothetical protein